MADKELEKKDRRYHEGVLKKIVNNILVAFLFLLSLLPFWILFGISDLFYFIFRHLVKYRYKVIRENLTNAFPEKGEKEIQQITNKFYHHFCDLLAENIKLYSMSDRQARRRILIKETDALTPIFEQGKSVIVVGMHHNNWDWSSFFQTKLKHQVLIIYNPIRGNEAFEKFLLHSRQKWGSQCVAVHKSSRVVFNLNKMGKPTALALVADQTAPANSKLWTLFLNREAPFFSGPERIAIRTNQPIFFHRTRKIKRGFYQLELIPLFENPKEAGAEEIFLTYVRKMEEIIREEPEYYLWSHRRWKHKRPENIPLTL
ncbi:MAG: lysophospholipid acyltransferase family protein [Prolixibacteraceae bacterium]|nr:lysophospholipid acyltransferase family protein [Prolixibacteraceae bacterium]